MTNTSCLYDIAFFFHLFVSFPADHSWYDPSSPQLSRFRYTHTMLCAQLRQPELYRFYVIISAKAIVVHVNAHQIRIGETRCKKKSKIPSKRCPIRVYSDRLDCLVS